MTLKRLFILLLWMPGLLHAATDSDLVGDTNGDGLRTVTDIRQMATCLMSDGNLKAYGGHRFVNLGLTSGLLWAYSNVGTDEAVESGDYFAWGETVPKQLFEWDNYQWGDSDTSLTRYCLHSASGQVDSLTTLQWADDAASVNMGSRWRTPSFADFAELRTQCSWYWSSKDGVNGYYIIGKNGNSIFLPAAGYCSGEEICNNGVDGFYWTRELYNDYNEKAYGYYISDSFYSWATRSRETGRTIRAVTPRATLYFDVNGDGSISLADLTALINLTLEQEDQDLKDNGDTDLWE